MLTSKAALVIAFAGLTTQSVLGDVIVFENTDYEFTMGGLCVACSSAIFDLSITDGPGEQARGWIEENEFGFYSDNTPSSPDVSINSLNTGWPGGIAQGESLIRYHPWYETDVTVVPALALDVGDTVDGSLNYGSSGVLWANLVPRQGYVPQDRFYAGVTITLDDGVHYGFIEFEDDPARPNTFRDYWRVVSWGYETEPETGLVIPASACGVADVVDPIGTLNFFDVSAFISAMSNQDLIADLNDDGEWNFLDVSAFLSAYNDGCP